MNIPVPNASSLVFYSLPNFAGTSLTVTHGQTGIVASSAATWVERSVSVPGTDGMYTFIWSAVDTGNPALSYAGHDEQYIRASLPYIENAFPSPQYPLQFLGISASLAVPVFVQLSGDFPAENCLAATALVPGSASPVTTFVSSRHDGALGFIQPVNGASTLVSLMTGTLSASDSTVQWTGAASLMLIYANNTVTFSSASGLPDGWTFNAPTLQPDGSWLVTLSAGQASNTGILYTGANYTGSSETFSPHESLQANAGSGWLWRSVKLSDMPALLYSSFNPVDAAYDYTGYQLIRMSSDTPDFGTVFTGNLPAQLLALDRADVQIVVSLNTSAADDAVIALTQVYPSAFYAAVTHGNTGLLAIIPASGAAQSITVQSGVLNADGSATFSRSGELSVSLSGGVPVITPVAGIPSDWSFSTPAEQADGTWLVTLTDAVARDITLYDSTDYQGDSRALAPGESTLLRSLPWQWNWLSARLNGGHLFSHTAFLDADTFDFRTYADSYDTGDVPDLSVPYPGIRSAAPVEGTALGPDRVVIRIALAPDESSQAVAAVTLQTAATGMLMQPLASVTNGLLTVPGVLAVMSRQQAPVALPLQVGEMDTATGLVTWQVFTTLIATWSDEKQRPELALGSDAPDDWILYPPQAAEKPGEYRTVLAGPLLAPGVTPRGPRGITTGNSPTGILTALDASTLQPAEALWQYEGERQAVQAMYFDDIDPTRPLHVRSGKGRRAITLRPANVAGTYDTQVNSNAFAALTDSGSVVAWGDSDHGGSVPPDIASRTDLVALAGGGKSAFAALSRVGSVVAWGDSNNGGSIPADIASRTGLTNLTGNWGGFAALTASGGALAWGNSAFGGSVPAAISARTDLISLVGNSYGFSALTRSGGVVAWGDSSYGGLVPADIASRTDLSTLSSSDSAYAALTRSGSAVAWGYSGFGGTIPAGIASRTDLVSLTGNSGAFAALTSSGSVVSWGWPAYGGSVPASIASRTDLVSVAGSAFTFAALTASGGVVAWGNSDYGAVVPASIANRTDLISITASWGAYAALTASGEVVTWGSTLSGATIPADIVPLLTGVVALYANMNNFLALKADNSIVVWGNDSSGKMNNVPSSLQGNISYTK